MKTKSTKSTNVQFKYAPTEGDMAMGFALLRFKQWIEFKLKTDKAPGGKEFWTNLGFTNSDQIHALTLKSLPHTEEKKHAMAQRILDQCEASVQSSDVMMR